MKRAALYARFSSDLQDERSITDQLALCRDRAAREGWSVVATYTDAALSGAALANRPGILALLNDAEAGAFDLVVAEGLDRLSRGQADTPRLLERLTFRGIKIITLAEGEITELHAGLLGTMNAMLLKQIATKVKRGQIGRLREGKIPGGLCYGYDVTGLGERRINAAEAEVVLRIFRDYIESRSPLQIASALNHEGVPGPRRRQWNASTINGSRARGNGILNNRLYIGEVVYNRQRFVKDPDTGRRQARPNAEADWLRQPVPELRIVPQDLWDAAQAQRRVYASVPLPRTNRPRHALSGLLACGTCGGAYVMIGPNRLGCAARYNRGTCANNRTISAKLLERQILDGIGDQLLAPDIVREAIAAYREAMRAKIAAGARERGDSERRLRDVAARERRVVALIEEGADAKPLLARLNELAAEREVLEARLRDIESPVVELHPNAAESYRNVVADLSAALREGTAASHKAIAALRALVTKVVIVPGEPRGPVALEIHGDLAALLSPDGRPRPECMTALVAGVGFEPTTFRL